MAFGDSGSTNGVSLRDRLIMQTLDISETDALEEGIAETIRAKNAHQRLQVMQAVKKLESDSSITVHSEDLGYIYTGKYTPVVRA
jgi:hypothetical protein